MKKQILTTGFVVFSFMLPLKATAASFTGIYTFGDSLSDVGNVFNTTFNQIPPSPYFNGRFSNGPIWVERLADKLGLNPIPFTTILPGTTPTEGINFAYGGATTGTQNTLSLTPGYPPFFPPLPGLEQQINQFTGSSPQADANALYILWAGANDYLPTQSTFTPFQTPDQTIENLSTAVTSLFNVGARNIMVFNLPDLGNTPSALSVNQQFPGFSLQLNALTQAHNQQLTHTLDNLSNSLAGINLIPVDINSLFENILQGEFGFTNVTTPCLQTLVCVADPTGDLQNQFLFWDANHPTTAAHQLIGDLAFQTLKENHQKSVPESSTVLGVLVLAGLGSWGNWRTVFYSKSTVRCLNCLRNLSPILRVSH